MDQKLEMKLRSLIKDSYHDTHNTIEGFMGGPNHEESDMSLDALKKSGFMKSYNKSRHTVGSDSLAGVVELLNEAINAPTPATIGRSLVNIIRSTTETVKIRLPKLAIASDTDGNSTGKGNSVGERNDFVTLTADKTTEDSEQYNDNDLENMPWNVAQSQVKAIAIGHDIKETTKILAFYNSLNVSQIATGAVLKPVIQQAFGWSDVVNLWTALGNFTGTALMMSKKTYGKLMKDPDFKDETILGDMIDPATGNFGGTMLGLTIFVSTLQDDNVVLAIDTSAAGQYLLKRDKVLKSFQADIDEFKIQVSTRYDLKLGRDGSVAKLDISLAP